MTQAEIDNKWAKIAERRAELNRSRADLDRRWAALNKEWEQLPFNLLIGMGVSSVFALFLLWTLQFWCK